jgi:hypothetical protein
MKNKTRMLLAGTAATVALAAAGVGTAMSLDSDGNRPERQPSVVEEGPVLDATPNPWAANDCAVLLEVFGEDAHAYGC